jgi:hypothetical protein
MGGSIWVKIAVLYRYDTYVILMGLTARDICFLRCRILRMCIARYSQQLEMYWGAERTMLSCLLLYVYI